MIAHLCYAENDQLQSKMQNYNDVESRVNGRFQFINGKFRMTY